MRKVLIVTNPSSGKNNGEKAAAYLKDLYAEKEVAVEIGVTEKEEDIRHFSKKAADENFETIAAIGGDGTVSLLINGLKNFERRPNVGIIPTGTVNNVSRALGIDQEWQKACKQLVEGEEYPADIGKVNEALFVSTVSAGTIPERASKASAKEKEKFGPLAYIFEGLDSLRDDTTFTFELTVDGKKEVMDLDLLLIGTSSSAAGYRNFFKNMPFDDGFLHLFGLKDSSLSEKVLEFSKLMTGSGNENMNGDLSFRIPFKKAEIRLLTGSLNTAIDGETGSGFPITLEVLPKFITFIVPKKEGTE